VSDPLIIEAAPRGPRQRVHRWLATRRFMLAGVIALVEVIAFIAKRPSALLLATLAVVLLVVCVATAVRVEPGIARELLIIVAIAQAIVVVIPILVGISVITGLIVAVVVIVALIAIALRWRG
jgi:hypothetical protein